MVKLEKKNCIAKTVKTALFAALILVSLVGGAMNVSAFSFGGYDISFKGGIKKIAEPEPATPTGQDNDQGTEAEEAADDESMLSAEEIQEAVQAANADKGATGFLKSAFSEDYFCVETESRVTYMRVMEDGSIRMLNEKPEKCYTVRTTERYLSRAWERHKNGEIVTIKELKENVDLPYRVKLKVAIAKGKSIFT